MSPVRGLELLCPPPQPLTPWRMFLLNQASPKLLAENNSWQVTAETTLLVSYRESWKTLETAMWLS